MLSITSQTIYDNFGIPTIEITIKTKRGSFTASVPNHDRKNLYNLIEMKDLDKKTEFFNQNFSKNIGPMLVKKHFPLGDQRSLDEFLSKEVHPKPFVDCDCANGILAISLAFLKASAAEKGTSIVEHVASMAHIKRHFIPNPIVEVLTDSIFDKDSISVNSLQIIPNGISEIAERLKICSEIFHKLRLIVTSRYGKFLISNNGSIIADEVTLEEALQLLNEAVTLSGHCGKVYYGMNVDAENMILPDGRYKFNREHFKEDNRQSCDANKLSEIYQKLSKYYPIRLFEDPFSQRDCKSWMEFNSERNFEVIGSRFDMEKMDLVFKKNAITGVTIWMNELKTVSDLIALNGQCRDRNIDVVLSTNRSDTGETIISDLAVGLGCKNVKFGGFLRNEKNAKYNRLLTIDRELRDSPKLPRGKEQVKVFA